VVVSVKVTNQGAGRARNSRVQVFLGGATTPNFYLSYPALAPGKSVTAQFTWTASANPYTFRFVADGYGDVAESDDTNNEVVVQRTSTLLPDLLISPTYMLDNPAGGAFSFGLIVVNQGSGRSTAALMRL
jgi:subtilase family serine protease